MNNKRFEEQVKVILFKAITHRLRERGLVTRDEFEKIMENIEKEETDLIAAKPLKDQELQGKLTEVE